ncbi:MAG: glutamate--tRNA ligase [Hyphomicrobiaceae bacterium]
MSASPVVRFAPSPTGLLHVGNIRTALFNWLFQHKAGGTFLLRLDDTDRARSREEFAEAIRADLRWLGLTWSREERQSDRVARYEAVMAELVAAGRLYPCFETEAELERRRKLQLARGVPPVYDRAALNLSEAEREALRRDGRTPHWRFKLDVAPTGQSTSGGGGWDDLIRGPQAVSLASLSDPVLVRADGSFLYTFTSVVDDVDFGVTHVIRGEDHVTNTAVQMDIFRALGAHPPAFAHHSLLVGADGSALSKRLGSLSVRAFREAGLEPMAVLSYVGTIGTSDPVTAHDSLRTLAAGFELSKISRAPVRFDVAELEALNAKLMHHTDFETVRERLLAAGIGQGEAFWLAVRGNLSRFADVVGWWQVVAGECAPVREDPEFLAAAREALPVEPWTVDTWREWTERLKASSGRKGKALFHPLRLALTGREAGPEMRLLLPLMGRERVARRLAD